MLCSRKDTFFSRHEGVYPIESCLPACATVVPEKYHNPSLIGLLDEKSSKTDEKQKYEYKGAKPQHDGFHVGGQEKHRGYDCRNQNDVDEKHEEAIVDTAFIVEFFVGVRISHGDVF